MKTSGSLNDISISFPSRNAVISLEVAAKPEEFEKYLGKDLDIDIDVHREKRSKNANALLWHCIGKLAQFTGRDKWTEYLELLKEYGTFTYTLVKPNAVEAFKRQWRESECIGEVMHNGERTMQMLCYFGSSTYNTKEFSVLLDGTISKMQDAGLDVPPTVAIKMALETWEKEYGTKEEDTQENTV